MSLFTGNQRQYYDNSQEIVASANQTAFTFNFSPAPATASDFDIFVNGSEVSASTYSYNNNVVTFSSGRAAGDIVVLKQVTFSEELGNYQYININDIINNFIINYVGEDKLIPKVKRTDIAFHVQRGMQEFSYDTLKSEKSQEIEIPPSLKMKLPHDYVNYVKLTWKDTSGIERVIYPAIKTSNPKALLQDGSYNYLFNSDNTLLEASESDTWSTYKAQGDGNETEADTNQNAVDQVLAEGRRYGLEPSFSQGNGVFYIDNTRGFIHFSSDLNTKTITLKYISDGVATEAEKIIHKFAEDAIYKYVAHAILSARSLVPEYLVARFKKEKFAAIRKAKLRLSNLKAEELSQVLRNKSKVIKH
tara:strand:- start:3301 stop:4383 length:1083 start_codon:yes stop_codon:yes gene_type:complete